MPIDPEGPHGPLFSFRDGTEFAAEFPELAPLAPVADAIRMLNLAGPPAERGQQAETLTDAVAVLSGADPTREDGWIEDAAYLDGKWSDQLDNCITRLDAWGLEVDPDTGAVTLPNGERGPNPSVVTLAACLVLDAMDLEPTDEVDNEVGAAVAARLRRAFMYPDLDGTDESFKKTLRRHLVDPTRYRLAQRRR